MEASEHNSWQSDRATLVSERLLLCRLGGLCIQQIQDLIQWHTISHVVLCGSCELDEHVGIATKAVSSCGSQVTLHVAIVGSKASQAFRDVLENAHESIARVLFDELAGSVLVACSTGSSYSAVVVIAHLMLEHGRGPDLVFREVSHCHWCIWLNTFLINELLHLWQCMIGKAGRGTTSEASQMAIAKHMATHSAWATARNSHCERPWEAVEAAWDAAVSGEGERKSFVNGNLLIESTFQQCMDRVLETRGQCKMPTSLAKHPRQGSGSVGTSEDADVVSQVDVGLSTPLIVIEQGCVVRSLVFASEYGHQLWPAGHALAVGLAQDLVLPLGALIDKAVLEIGAGVGLPGIVAARKGARSVWLTDQREIVGLMTKNAQANGLGDIIRCAELDWLNVSASPAASVRFDYVIAADVVYAQHMDDFAKALVELVPTGTTLLLAYTKRPGCETVLREQILARFQDVRCVALKAGEFVRSDAEIYILRGYSAS